MMPRSMKEISRFLQGANLFEVMASYFLALYVSAFFLIEQNSPLLAAVVWMMPAIAPLISANWVVWLQSKFRATDVLAAFNLCKTLLAVSITVTMHSQVMLTLALLAVLGALDFAGRPSYKVALGRMVPVEQVSTLNARVNTARYLGAGLAGAIMLLFGQVMVGIVTVNVIHSALLLCAGLLLLQLRKAERFSPCEVVKRMSLIVGIGQFGALLRRRTDLLEPVGGFLLFSLVFNGVHNVARTVFPVDVLGLGVDGIGLVQLCSAAAVAIGAALAVRELNIVILRATTVAWGVLSSALMVGAFYVPSITVAVLFYSLAALVFIYKATRLESALLERAEQSDLPLIATYLNAVSSFNIAVFILGLGILTEFMSLPHISLWVFAVFIALVVALRHFCAKVESRPNPHSTIGSIR